MLAHGTCHLPCLCLRDPAGDLEKCVAIWFPPSFANMGLEMVRRSCCSLVSLQRGVLPRKRLVHCANGSPTVSVVLPAHTLAAAALAASVLTSSPFSPLVGPRTGGCASRTSGDRRVGRVSWRALLPLGLPSSVGSSAKALPLQPRTLLGCALLSFGQQREGFADMYCPIHCSHRNNFCFSGRQNISKNHLYQTSHVCCTNDNFLLLSFYLLSIVFLSNLPPSYFFFFAFCASFLYFIVQRPLFKSGNSKQLHKSSVYGERLTCLCFKHMHCEIEKAYLATLNLLHSFTTCIRILTATFQLTPFF